MEGNRKVIMKKRKVIIVSQNYNKVKIKRNYNKINSKIRLINCK